ncbi:MAG: hypothetical protein A2076_00750 [Geobacteraceae bacterium GWC2_53_11]|nr:MAG: hypothetical protein A2076_00750 [Geobacteraceae bacterium GWC2_53_11]
MIWELTHVPGKVTYLGFSLIFTPTDLLEANSQYTATITTGVKDIAGNALPSDYVWSWTTGSSLNMATPVIQYTIPLNTQSSAKSLLERHFQRKILKKYRCCLTAVVQTNHDGENASFIFEKRHTMPLLHINKRTYNQ